jgi:apolipoprotein N-acyltransferase
LRFFLPFFASVFSGFLLVLAFPSYDLEWLVWIGLIPLILSIYDRSPIYGFLLSFIFGVVFFTGVCNWIFETNGYTIFHHAFVCVVLATPLGLFGFVFGFLSRRWGGTLALIAAPCVWVVMEYLRSNLSFLSLPWGLLGHSQYEILSVIQISAITGVYGVSFLVAMVNSSLSATILAFTYKVKQLKTFAPYVPSKHTAMSLLFATAVLISLSLLYGQLTLVKPIGRKTIKLSVLQGNIDQTIKWDPKYRNFIMERYTTLSREALKDRPILIIWPEAATPGLVLKNMVLMQQILSLIRELKTYFLIGSSEYPKFQKTPLKHGKFGNTALLFSPKGKILGQYLKIRLVPFAEYLPFEGKISWPEFIVTNKNINYEIPGKEIILFEINQAKFGSLICWETIFPQLFRSFVRNGANLMINITNEGWFHNKAISYQYVAMNIFRAVENRVFIVRCANTGVSCFIDSYGRIVGKVEQDGKDTYVRGHLSRNVTISEAKTFYTVYGDVFVYICLTVSILITVIAFFKPRKDLA